MSKEKSPPSAVKIRGWFQGIMKSMRTVRPTTKNETSQNSMKKCKNKVSRENFQSEKDSDLASYQVKQSPNLNFGREYVEIGLKTLDEINYHEFDKMIQPEDISNSKEGLDPSKDENDDVFHNESIQVVEDEEEKEICLLWQTLAKYPSPFVWRPKLQVIPNLPNNFLRNLAAKDIEFAQAKPNLFRDTTVILVLSYERSINGETDKAIEELLSSFEKLTEAKQNLESELNEEAVIPSGPDGDNEDSEWMEKSEKSYDSMSKSAQIERINALLQVVHVTLANIAHLRGNLSDALRLLLEPQLSIPLGVIGKATLLAAEGTFLCEYGIEGNKRGFQLFKQALELEPDYWEWNYYAGKVVGRLRRVAWSKDVFPEIQEMIFLEKAVSLYRQNASSLVHLANLYRVLAQIRYRYQTNLESQADQLHPSTLPQINRKKPIARNQWRSVRDADPKDDLHKIKPSLNDLPAELVNSEKNYLLSAQDLYKEALNLESLCPYNNARCAKGFWSLPYPYKNKEKAQEAILQALRLAPDDTLVNHYAGLFYENVRDDKKALQCYERAIANGRLNYPAELSFINLKLKVSPPGSHSPIFRLEELLYKYPNCQYKIQTLCLKGVYLYKEERLLLQALQCFYNAIQIDPTHSLLKKYYPGTYFSKYGEFYNIFQLCKKIAILLIENPNFSGDKEHFKEIILELDQLE